VPGHGSWGFQIPKDPAPPLSPARTALVARAMPDELAGIDGQFRPVSVGDRGPYSAGFTSAIVDRTPSRHRWEPSGEPVPAVKTGTRSWPGRVRHGCLPPHGNNEIRKRILPEHASRVRFVEHIARRGVDLFRAVCEHDVEGVVAKWRNGTYQSGPHTSWMKLRNPHYSQWDGRRELFEARRDSAQRRTRWVKPVLSLS
jgi:hypothetical protein